MEERIYISRLLDLYGELLTRKQKDIMDLYYNDDLSLSEISEHTNTSRQAVFDILKRCHKQLVFYESKLNLLEKSKHFEETYNTLSNIIKDLEVAIHDKEIKKSLDELRNTINIMNEII